MLSLVAGLLGTTWQARRARLEATQAAADRDRAERVSALLVDMFRLSDPGSTRGRTVTAQEVLAQGAQRITNDLADQPEPQADLLTEIGQIYQNLGLFDDAGVHLERALQLRRSVHGEDHPLVAGSLTRLAQVRVQQGRAQEGVQLAGSAATILRQRVESVSDPALADALIALGGALRGTAAPTQAAAAYAEAVTLLNQRSNRDDARAAQAFFGWADAAHSQGQFDLADSLLQQTITRYAALPGPPHPDAATSLNNLGMLRTFRRRPAEAEPLLRHALELRRRIYGAVHPAVAETLSGLAQTLSLLGRYPDAAAIGNEAVAVYDSALGRDHVGSAQVRLGLGFILLKVDQGERALQLMDEANAVFRAQPQVPNSQIVAAETISGQAYSAMGQFDQARAQFIRTLRLCEAKLGPEHAACAGILVELARLEHGADRLSEAETYARQSIALTSRILRPDHRFALWATITLAQVEAARGRLQEADSLLRGVLETQRTTIGHQHPESAVTMTALADVELRRGQAAAAAARARTAITIFESHHEPGPALPEARSVLGGALLAQGRIREAEPLLRSAHQELTRMRATRRTQLSAAAERLSRLTSATQTPPGE
jgi:tetratricopeptide (TPR) repeat protein